MVLTSVGTTSIGLRNVIVQLVLNPECQERLAEELQAAGDKDEVVGSKFIA